MFFLKKIPKYHLYPIFNQETTLKIENVRIFTVLKGDDR